ncbi:MAG TPA: hypothetical protein VGW12_10740 [Pyrinomonadaceae bacterium]|nr:hypothetical protein [Pyrinomonadaceae bacterium]
MRVADGFTVTNNFSERVCYWIFKTDDTSYWASYEGKWGWLGTGESARFDLNMGKVKISFRKGEGSFDDWHASPVEVENNRPVELTDEKRIVQSSDKFPNPNESKSVNFVDDFIVKVDDIARMVVLAAIGKIPEVGLGVSAVVGFFWPVK